MKDCSTLITYSVAGPSNLAPETVCITGSILNTCTDPKSLWWFWNIIYITYNLASITLFNCFFLVLNLKVSSEHKHKGNFPQFLLLNGKQQKGETDIMNTHVKDLFSDIPVLSQNQSQRETLIFRSGAKKHKWSQTQVF